MCLDKRSTWHLQTIALREKTVLMGILRENEMNSR